MKTQPDRLSATPDEADLYILGLANEKGKFAIEVGLRLKPCAQEALERGMDNEWFTLIDISHANIAPSLLLRIFRLTPAGKHRLSVLKTLEQMNAGGAR